MGIPPKWCRNKKIYQLPGNILVPPRWVIEPSDVFVVKGRSIIVDCQTEGFPQPRVRWTKAEDNLVALHFKYDFWHMTATAGSDVVQSGRPIFDDFFQHLWPYTSHNTANVVFQMVKRLWLIRIDK
ncbi:adhesion G protein-coupled receptor B2 [Trichonephila clavipes]|nr:adhesion G protein-coupled receptor B2 [Trichonephila clavipes]